MPMPTPYPGVYIEEIPSGVRTITGVATSITAFVGRTLWGQTPQPTVISSFADFERRFGGLAVDMPMTYAVQDFYLNGGSHAIIVRLFKAPAGGTGVAKNADTGLTLAASSPGSWANKAVTVALDTNIPKDLLLPTGFCDDGPLQSDDSIYAGRRDRYKGNHPQRFGEGGSATRRPRADR
jgi:hypothetical protein